MLSNIGCRYKEYKGINNNWILEKSIKTTANSSIINSMIEASNFFTKNGGIINIHYKSTKKFNLQVSKIECISHDRTTKKEYIFSYYKARYIM